MVENGTEEDPNIKEESKESNTTQKNSRVTVDDLYRRSTQYQVWSYTSEGLQEAKQKTNEKGRGHAIQLFENTCLNLKADSKDFQQYESELTADKLLDLLTLEEELKYLNFYCENIMKVTQSFRMPTQVKATAVSFFKKFYLINSVMEYHPKNVLYTCVFLAAKSENYFMSIETFCKALPKTEPKDVLDLEFIVLQSLQFTLLVHHPFRPLYGFFLDFQGVLLHPNPVMYDVSVDTIGSLYDKAKKWLIDFALLSDASFLFTPPQIALAAMYDIDRRITDKYLKKKFLSDLHHGEEHKNEKLESIKEETEVKQEPKEETIEQDEPEVQQKDKEQEEERTSQREQYEAMVRTIRKCIKLAKQTSETSREESAKIDKKCFFALNPTRLIKRKLNKLTTSNEVTPVPNAT